MNNLAPVVLFVYNRTWHAEQTLDALMQNELADHSVLYIYADGPKENATEEQLNKIQEVRHLIRSKQWCREVNIIEAEKNKGLADSIINGVTEIVNKYGKIIVLEDDLITSKGFLKYMNDALLKYENEERIMQVSGYIFPINCEAKNAALLLPFTTSWGWATWKKSWQYFDPSAKGYEELKTNKSLSLLFDLDGTYPYTQMLITQMEGKSLSSWAIRWWWAVFIKKGIVIYPDKSLIENIGFGQDATHTIQKNPFENSDFEINYFIKHFPNSIKLDLSAYNEIQKNFQLKIGYSKIKKFNINRIKEIGNNLLRNFI